MMRYRKLEHRFVETLPEKLEAGVLYVSFEFCLASHACCCGCGEEVVTPFSPLSWEMTFDGETVSLWPSVGNWTLPCRSHYVIERGLVRSAPAWSDAQVEAAQRRERAEREQHYGTTKTAEPAGQTPTVSPPAAQPRRRWWSRLWRLLFGTNG